MTVLIKNTIYFLILFYTPGLVAEEVKQTVSSCETAINCSVSQGNTTTAGATTEGGSSVRRQASGNTTTTNFGSAGETGSGAYTQANAAKKKANGTMLAAFGLSAVLATMCNPPHNIVPCILSPIAAVAGMLAGRKKKEAQQVMNSLGNDGTGEGDVGNTGDTGGTGTTAEGVDTATASLASIKADLGKKGVIMNDDGSVVLPNGKTIAADLNTQSLQNAGLDNSQIAQLGSGLEKLKKDMIDASGNTKPAEEVNLAGSGAGSGGYDGGRTKLDGNSREISSSSVEADRTVLNRDPAAWTGFSTKYGDSQIGVQQSDIFLMVEKRVENERKVMGQ